MIVAIADTHAEIWYLFSDARLGRSTSAFIDATIARGDHIGILALARHNGGATLKQPNLNAGGVGCVWTARDIGNTE